MCVSGTHIAAQSGVVRIIKQESVKRALRPSDKNEAKRLLDLKNQPRQVHLNCH